VIKRIRFAARAGDVSPEAFPARWARAVSAAATAPPEVRPARIAVCTSIPGLTDDDPRHDGVGIEWFGDRGRVARYEQWLASAGGRPVRERADRILAADRSAVVVAEECVVRGADWLARRWRDGGGKLKHMALAVRAPALTAEEFAERWRRHAGTLRPAGAAPMVIPDDVRGLAYIQNYPLAQHHPLAPPGDGAYDAVNEVYFDDPAGLRSRIAWFRENLPGRTDDLVHRSWFLAVREEVVLGQ
jgi:hypothetical protein